MRRRRRPGSAGVERAVARARRGRRPTRTRARRSPRAGDPPGRRCEGRRGGRRARTASPPSRWAEDAGERCPHGRTDTDERVGRRGRRCRGGARGEIAGVGAQSGCQGADVRDGVQSRRLEGVRGGRDRHPGLRCVAAHARCTRRPIARGPERAGHWSRASSGRCRRGRRPPPGRSSTPRDSSPHAAEHRRGQHGESGRARDRVEQEGAAERGGHERRGDERRSCARSREGALGQRDPDPGDAGDRRRRPPRPVRALGRQPAGSGARTVSDTAAIATKLQRVTNRPLESARWTARSSVLTRRAELGEVERARPDAGVGPRRAEVETGEDAAHRALDGARRRAPLARDLLVRASACDEGEHLDLPAGEPGQRGRALRHRGSGGCRGAQCRLDGIHHDVGGTDVELGDEHRAGGAGAPGTRDRTGKLLRKTTARCGARPVSIVASSTPEGRDPRSMSVNSTSGSVSANRVVASAASAAPVTSKPRCASMSHSSTRIAG